MNSEQLQKILEAALFACDEPVTVDALRALFSESEDRQATPSREEIRATLGALQESYADRGVELKEVASGYRFQINEQSGAWVNRLWEERSPRYSRALLETLAIIAYRQPVTRGEIEDIRGVSVSTGIVRNLMEREWIRVAGYRDVPGRPTVYTTTRQFLDYFNLKNLSELPSLAQLRDIEDVNTDLFTEPAELPDQPTADQQLELDSGVAITPVAVVSDGRIEPSEPTPSNVTRLPGLGSDPDEENEEAAG